MERINKYMRQQQQWRKTINQTALNIEKIVHDIRKAPDTTKIGPTHFLKICQIAKDQFKMQHSLLRIQGPVFVATGTLGNIFQLQNILGSGGPPKYHNYIFLGDYAGYYKNSIECLIVLLGYKIHLPFNFFLLRGCNEIESVCMTNNIKDQLMDYFGGHWEECWRSVQQVFAEMPFAAIINNRILCIHGGITPELTHLEQIDKIPRTLQVKQKSLAHCLLTSNPTNKPSQKWCVSPIENYPLYSYEVIAQFLQEHALDMICRAHEIPYEGFQYNFPRQLLTICSLSKYCNKYNNKSAMMMVDVENNVIVKMLSNNFSYRHNDKQEQISMVQLFRQKHQQNKQQKLQEKKSNEIIGFEMDNDEFIDYQ